MPRTTDADKAARRRQIIDAAYQCFARKGIHQTSMRDIYQEAHVSAGAVYHYFKSKEEIMEASFQFDANRSQSLFDTAKRSEAPVQALIELSGVLFAGLAEAAALGASRVHVQAWAEALTNPRLLDTIRHAFDGYNEALTAIMANAQTKAAINPRLDPCAIAHALMSLYLGLELQKAWNPDLDMATYRDVVMALVAGTFRVPEGDGGQSGQGIGSEGEDTGDRVNNRDHA